MDLKTMVGTAEVLLKVLQKCEAAGEIKDAEQIVLSQWLTELKSAISSQQLAEDIKEEVVVETEPIAEPEQVAEPIIEQEEPATEQPQQTEEEIEELVVIERPKLNRDAVKSLYEDDTEAENLPEPEDFIVEKEITLSPEDERIIVNLELPRDVNTAAKAGSPLTQLIGINDKFIITRDLFGGDTFAFNRTLATLDNFDDLNDALIYLQKTYDWDTNSDGAQLLIEKLVTKLG